MKAGVLFPFPGTQHASLAAVGAKGAALIALAQAGHAVPAGVVIGTAFFQDWADAMQTSPDWALLRTGPPKAETCERLQALAQALPFSAAQQAVLRELRQHLPAALGEGLLALRSSSPLEDGQAASFAGVYLTRLALRAHELEAALRDGFAALFAPRLFAYLHAKRLPLDAPPALALVLQRQLDSEVAGVAFSMNPLNNDADEALVSASWGQGESVVAGEVEPDQWLLCKRSGRVLESSLGSKRVSRRLRPEGGLVEAPVPRAAEACLTAAQRAELLALLRRVEAEQGQPVDLEWAWAEGRLWLLQARPITTRLPLPPLLQTQADEPRRLYMDIALSSGLTLNAPASALGLDVLRRAMAGMGALLFGPWRLRPGHEHALLHFEGGRMYLALSNLLWLSSPRQLARSMEQHDAAAAQALAGLDARRCRSARRPHWARARQLLRLPALLWRLRGLLGTALLPFLAPQWASRSLRARLQAFEARLAEPVDEGLPLDAFWQQQVGRHLPTLLNDSLAAVAPGAMALLAFQRLARGVRSLDDAQRAQLDRGFAGNVVVEMSLAMHALAQALPPEAVGKGGEALAQRLQEGTLPAPFLAGWAAFLQRHGGRAPMEMDLARPRYADAPALALAQIAAMPVKDPARDPARAVQAQIERRRAAVAALLAAAGPLRRPLLRRLNEVLEAFMGLRDTPKQHFLTLLQGLRPRLLAEGRALQQAGRLDAAEQVFELRFDELHDASLDLRALHAGRAAFRQQLEHAARPFPALIDSRGRILHAPPAPVTEPGVLQGRGLAPGRVRGPARTLASAQDGPLRPGEVLIAYTTDPGWTPLFVNAAAVVLEIGGALQHGAVVARELGLPCIAGIPGISQAIPDGEWLEVDGATGRLRRLAGPSASAQAGWP